MRARFFNFFGGLRTRFVTDAVVGGSGYRVSSCFSATSPTYLSLSGI